MRTDVATAARQYSSALKGDSPRQLLAQGLPDGDEPSWPPSWNRWWARVRATAAGALAGRIPNPCPGAEHFGAPDLEADVERGKRATSAGRWRRVRCREQVGNTFYALTTAVVRARVAAGGRQ